MNQSDVTVWARPLQLLRVRLDHALSSNQFPEFRGEWIDVHLLASALVGRLKLWTTDPALATLAKELGISYD
jgi:hypothetical protein